MIKLYGHPMSTCTRKVLFTLHETATPFEFVLVDFAKGEHKQQPHLSRQPFGQVPALEDDGFAMYESRAMARYVDAKAGGKLTPFELKTRAVMEQWISVESSDFTPHAMKFVFHSVFQRAQTPEALDKAGAALDVATDVLDRNLADRSFLAGDQLSLADVTFAPYVDYVLMTPAKDRVLARPNLAAWWNRVSERPAWRKTLGK